MPLYLEDLHIGQRFLCGSQRMAEDRIKAFAAEFDPQPFHLDETAAQASIFRGIAASGWHTASVSMRLVVEGFPLANGLVGLGGEISWPKPTRPGDTLRVECEIVDILPSKSKPNQAIVIIRNTAFNQHEEAVYIFTAKVLAYRRTG